MSTLWFTARNSVCVLLLVWVAATGVLVDSDVLKQFVWLSVSVGLAGILGGVLKLAIPAHVILVADVAMLATFVVSFEVLKKRQATTLERIKNPPR